MKARSGRLFLDSLSVLLAVLISVSAAWAQSSDGTVPAALAGTMLMFVVVVCLAGYVYMALALQTIAIKTSTENGWLAWIPIANIFLMLNVAKKPLWWFVLFLVPIVHIVIAIMVCMAVAEARHKPNWWGVLTIVPVVNIVVPGYLAWSD